MADVSSASAQPSGYDEKRDVKPINPPHPGADDDEDEDIDALIDELESQDGHDLEEEGEEDGHGNIRQVPEEMLQTSTVTGLTNEEVLARRRKYGLNAMKEERVCILQTNPLNPSNPLISWHIHASLPQ
jgi:H+-transporting ATPase